MTAKEIITELKKNVLENIKKQVIIAEGKSE